LSTIVDKYALNTLSIGPYAGIKYGIAAILFLAINPPKFKKFINPHSKELAIKLLINSLQLSLFYLGVSQLSGFNIVIVAALTPILIFVSSILIVHEKFRPRILTGLVVAVAGVSVMIFGGQEAGDSTNLILGNILLLGAVLADVVGTLYSKKLLNENVSSDTLAGLTLAWTAVFFLLVTIFSGGVEEVSSYGAGSWLLLLLSGVVFTMGPWVMYYRAFKSVEVEELSVYVYLGPVAGAVGAMIILRETPTVWVAIGGFLVMVGLWLSQHKAVRYKLHFYVPHHISLKTKSN